MRSLSTPLRLGGSFVLHSLCLFPGPFGGMLRPSQSHNLRLMLSALSWMLYHFKLLRVDFVACS